MATVTINQFRTSQFGSAPYGNHSSFPYQLVTNATGGATNANSSTALAIGDVVELGFIPAGMRLDDFLATVSTAFSASVTASLGFKYEDGVDDPTAPQDAAYFGAGIALSAPAKIRSTSNKAPIVLPKSAKLIMTMAGATNAKVAKLDVLLIGEVIGAK